MTGRTAVPLEVRRVDYTDPLVRPLLEQLDREYDARYGHTLGDLDEEVRRERARFAPPDGGLVMVLEAGVPVAGGAFRRWDAETAELKRIWTDTAHRRRGLARRVLAELEADIAALDPEQIGPHPFDKTLPDTPANTLPDRTPPERTPMYRETAPRGAP